LKLLEVNRFFINYRYMRNGYADQVIINTYGLITIINDPETDNKKSSADDCDLFISHGLTALNTKRSLH